MNTSKLSKNQLTMLFDRLLRLGVNCENKELGKENEESEICINFSLSSSWGKQLYKSLSDEVLLHVITDIAKELGHSPSQKEVFWVWREYIKLRFKKWPYALTAAGLVKNAGKGGQTQEQALEVKRNHDKMINEIREKAKVLGRIPHPKDLPEVCMELGKFRCSWQEALKEAGIDQDFFIKNSLFIINNLEEEYHIYLQEIEKLTNHLGRAPRRNEIDVGLKEKLITRCGTWRNTLYQIGLEPVTRITPFSSDYTDERQITVKRYHRNTLYDCYYKVINPDMQLKNDLIHIKNLAGHLHRPPLKNEVPEEIRLRLQKSCGSWANAIYQLKFIEN